MDSNYFFLGKSYELRLTCEQSRKRCRILLYQNQMILYAPADSTYKELEESLVQWYRKQAKAVIEAKALYYAGQLGVTFQTIRIKDQKSRWGSCSSKRNLNFNWRIVMAPEEVLTYVVVHELCHLLHMNHSKDFWNCVKVIMPEYKIYRTWLKLHGVELSSCLATTTF